MRLRDFRESSGLSGYRLAQLSGVRQATISEIEAGKIRPTIDTLEKLCKALDITLCQFFCNNIPEKPCNQSKGSPEFDRIIEKVKQLSPPQLKILEATLDEWKIDE